MIAVILYFIGVAFATFLALRYAPQRWDWPSVAVLGAFSWLGAAVLVMVLALRQMYKRR